METPIIERSMKQTDDAIAILKDVSALCEKAIAQRDELLAALKLAIPYLKDEQQRVDYEVLPLTKALAAIAKAKG